MVFVFFRLVLQLLRRTQRTIKKQIPLLLLRMKKLEWFCMFANFGGFFFSQTTQQSCEQTSKLYLESVILGSCYRFETSNQTKSGYALLNIKLVFLS